MKLSTLALVSSFTISSLASTHNPILAARQAHPYRSRSLAPGVSDTCAALDIDLQLLGGILKEDPPLTGHVNVCLCLSLVSIFLQENVFAKKAVVALGEPSVTTFIKAMINVAPGRQTCAYPAHATPLCEPDDVCAFECTDGYSSAPADSGPGTCICPAPNSECNGVCGYFPGGCASAVPATDSAPGRRRGLGTSPRCEGGEVCGVGRGTGWECVDTKRDLESCGGCTTPSPFESAPTTGTNRGVDCSAIPHVEEVSCKYGKCHVFSCTDGYIPSSTGEHCVARSIGVAGRRGVSDGGSSLGLEGLPGAANREAGNPVKVVAKLA